MLDDDLTPAKGPRTAKNLDPMSIDELESYIHDLKEEILRTEAEIDKKKGVFDAADSVFS